MRLLKLFGNFFHCLHTVPAERKERLSARAHINAHIGEHRFFTLKNSVFYHLGDYFVGFVLDSLSLFDLSVIKFLINFKEFISHKIIGAAYRTVRTHCKYAETHFVKAVEYCNRSFYFLLELLEGKKIGRGVLDAYKSFIFKDLSGNAL